MDRKIEPKYRKLKRGLTYGLIAAVAVALVYALFFREAEREYDIERRKLRIAAVTEQPFREFIPVDGTVKPAKTVYLDAVYGGRVERLYAQNGEQLTRGDTVLKLSNPTLELDYMNRENQMYDILNNLKTSELSLKRNTFDLKRKLLELDNQIAQAEQDYQTKKKLREGQAVSEQDYLDSKRRYEYLLAQRKLAVESQYYDSISTVAQISQLSASVGRMNRNLEMIEKNLDELYVRTPVEGILSAFSSEIGENIVTGQRLGQVDGGDGFKVTAPVDERFIARVFVGQAAATELNGRRYPLTITRINPNVTGGVFSVDLESKNELPDNLRRGQTLSIELLFGGADKSTVIPIGGFFTDTGGKWVFVLDDDGRTARKREVSIGRQNADYYEVKNGLNPGEEVIISSYRNFLNRDLLIIS